MTAKERNSLIAAIIIVPLILIGLLAMVAFGFSSSQRLPPEMYQDLNEE